MSISITETAASGAKRGGVDLLESIYRHNARRVRWVLRSRGVDEGMLDDLVHEVFVAVHRRLPQRDPAVSIPAFVAAVARNVAYSHRRAASRRADVIRRVEPPDPPEGPEVEVARRQAATMLQAFIHRLPPPQREAFVLGEVLGMTVPEIQCVVGAPADTLYSRLKAARKRFAAEFGPSAKGRRWARAVERDDARRRDRVWLGITAGLPRRTGPLGGVAGTTAIRWGLAVAASTTLFVGLGRSTPGPSVRPPQTSRVVAERRAPERPAAAPAPKRVLPTTSATVVAVAPAPDAPRPRAPARRVPRRQRPMPPEATTPETSPGLSLDATVRALRDAKRRFRAGDEQAACASLTEIEPAPALANEWRVLMTTCERSGAKEGDDNP